MKTPRLSILWLPVLFAASGLCSCSGPSLRPEQLEINREAALYEAYVRAQVARYSGDTDTAIEQARLAVAAGPEEPHVYHLLGQLLRSDGRLEEAATVLADGIAVGGDVLPLELELAGAYEELGENERAASTYQQAVARQTDQLEPHVAYSEFLTRTSDFASAQTVLDAYLSVFPDDAAGWRALGEAYRAGSAPEQALAAYEQAITLDPTVQADFSVAVSLARESGHIDRAGTLADTCLHHFRRSVSCRVELVRSLEELELESEELEERVFLVLQSLGRAIGANTGRLRRVEGLLRRELGEERALQFLFAVAADRERNTQIQSMTAWAAYYAGQEDVAVDYMFAVLVVRPWDPTALNFIGYSWAERGIRLDEAEQMVLAALAIRPDDGNIQDSLGWVYYQWGRYEDAVEWLEQAVERMPDSAVVIDHLADAYRAAGLTEQALEQYRQALLHADEDLASQIQKKIDELEQDGTT